MKMQENGKTSDDPLFRPSEITSQEQYEASRIVPVLSRDSPGDRSLLPAVRGRRELAGSAPGLAFSAKSGMIHFFLSVRDWQMSKLQYGRWNFHPFAEQPWLEVLSNFGGDPSIPRAAGLYCSLPVIFI